MNHVVIATSEADARAAVAVEQHHAELAGALALRVEAVVAAAVAGNAAAASAAQADLSAWCAQELLPHARAEEVSLYPAAQRRAEGRLLVEAMLEEHEVIGALVAELSVAGDPVRAAVAARALKAMFDSHLGKENDLILPLLVTASDVSVVALLQGMHEVLGSAGHDQHEAAGAQGAGSCGGSCGCSESDAAGFPELDARAVPHAIRHATVFGALDSVAPGGGLVLVAPHDPLPLLKQIQQRSPGAFAVDYLERGPEAWRLRFVRQPVG